MEAVFTSHNRPGTSFMRDESNTWWWGESNSPRTSLSLQIAHAACSYNFQKSKSPKYQDHKIMFCYQNRAGQKREKHTLLLLAHGDDMSSSLISVTISPRYNCRVIRSLLIFSSHSSSYKLDILLSSSNL